MLHTWFKISLLACVVLFIASAVILVKSYRRKRLKKTLLYAGTTAVVSAAVFVSLLHGFAFTLQFDAQLARIGGLMRDIREAQIQYRDDASRGAGEYAGTMGELKYVSTRYESVGGEMIVRGWSGYYIITTNKEYTQAVTAEKDVDYCLIRLWHKDAKKDFVRCDGRKSTQYPGPYKPRLQ